MAYIVRGVIPVKDVYPGLVKNLETLRQGCLIASRIVIEDFPRGHILA